MGIFAGQNFIFLMIMARLVEKEYHGIFAIANILIVFITMLGEGGTGAALIQRKEFNKYHLSFSFYLNITISLLLYAILIMSSEGVVEFYLHKFSEVVLYVIGINLLTSNIGVVSNSLLIRELDFRSIFYVNNCSYFLSHFVVGIYLGFNDYGVWSFVIPAVVFKILKSTSLFCLKPHDIKFYYRSEEAREILYFGVSYTLMRVLHYFSFQLDKLLLGKFLPITGLANYEKGQVLSQLPGNLIGNAFDPVLFSVLTKVRDNNTQTKALIGKLMNLLVFLMLGVSITLLFFSREVVIVVLGYEWIEAAVVVQVLGLVLPIQIISRLADVIIRTHNKIFHVLPVKIIYILMLGSSIYFGWQYGLTVISALVCTAIFIHGIMMAKLSFKFIDLSALELVRYIQPALILGVIITILTGIVHTVCTQLALSPISQILTLALADICLLLGIYWTFPQVVSNVVDVEFIINTIKKRVNG